ncbi:MAG: protein kinase [Oscillospiraceae bacterium]|nr:protein kinase [Oscillospiraceae bacterium]
MIETNKGNLCECCFAHISNEPCSECGYSPESYVSDPAVLPCGSALMGRYAVGRVIGMGGFGITYLAYDIKIGRKIAIKEFFPFGLAARGADHLTVSVSMKENSPSVFQNGAERFYEEASMVAGFSDNPNIVGVYDFFYENSTAYYTMEYLEGQTLKDHIVHNGVLSTEQAVFLAGCVADALMTVHGASILHRDISPDNIMLCSSGRVKLIDFGAARQVVADGSQNMSVILKPGFAPLEQYQKKGKQGPWTDIYSLGTTLFYALTGLIPDDPMTRLEDDEKFDENKYSINDGLWNIIRKATMLKISDRYKNISEFISDLERLPFAAEPIIKGPAMRTMSMPYGMTVGQQTMTTSAEDIPMSASEPQESAPAEESAPASEAPKAKKFPAAVVGIASAAVVIAAVICIAVFGKDGSDRDAADITKPEKVTETTKVTSEGVFNAKVTSPPVSEVTEAEAHYSEKSFSGEILVSGKTAEIGFDYSERSDEPLTVSGSGSSSVWIRDSVSGIHIYVNTMPMEKLAENLGMSADSIESVTYGKTTYKHMDTDSLGRCYKTELGGMYLTVEVGTESGELVRIADEYILPTIFIDIDEAVLSEATETEAPAVPETITIGGTEYSTDMTGILNLQNKGLKDSDIKDLKYMTNVTEIILSDNDLTDLSPLSGLTQLEKLTYHNNNVKDLSFAKDLKNLKTLGADNNGISDLSPLSGMTELTEIWLNINNISDVTPLKNCTKVQYLSLANNPISDCSALSGMTQLIQLYMHGCGLKSLEPFSGCTMLEVVYVGENQLTDLTPLAGNPGLKVLHATNNQLNGNCSALKGLTILDELYLTGNGYDAAPELLENYINTYLYSDEDGFIWWY